jgi:hypothetical protein
MWRELKPIVAGFGVVIAVWVLAMLIVGCGGALKDWSPEDLDKLARVAGIVDHFGPRADASLRTGRPIIIGMVNGFIVIPGTELDIAVSADPVRSSETFNVINPTIVGDLPKPKSGLGGA